MSLRSVLSKVWNKRFNIATMISPTLNTKMRYKYLFGKPLDLKNPTTFNEKLLWVKLNNYIHNPLVIQCADKYAVRDYIKDCGCGEILNDLIGVWDKAEDVPWEDLPQQFALKWNFGAGMNIICADKSKLDKKKTVEQLKVWGKTKFWLTHSEMQYKYAPKKIICEKYLNDGSGLLPIDYKLYCFNGKAAFLLLCVGRESGGHPKFYFFDKEWNFHRLTHDGVDAPQDFYIEKPACADALFQYAEVLSKPFPFVRMDFYAVGDKVYFGEMTFTPAGGLDTNRLPEADRIFAEMLDIDKVEILK